MSVLDNKHKELRILLVDDHMLMRSVITQSLKALGYKHIDTAASGTDALDMLRDRKSAGRPYHIAFLDWHMPEMDGMAVLRACREDKAFASLAIIMLTAEQEKKNVLQAIECGATSYIVKPVSQDALEKNMENIIRWLEKRGAANMDAPEPARKVAEASVSAAALSVEIQSQLRPVIARGVQKIFSNLFNVEIVPQDHRGYDLSNSLVCVGRLHQEGVSINLRFFFDQSLLKPLLMQLYSPQFLAEQAVYADAACEIVNILASQVKAFLNGHGYRLALDLPAVYEKPEMRQQEPVIDVRFSLNSNQYFLVDVTAGEQE